MKREEVSAIFPDATDEQISAILDKNGADINAAKSKNDTQVSDLKQQVDDLKGQISQRDTDLASLGEKLTAAQTDAGQLTEAKNAFDALKTQYEAEKAEWASKLKAQTVASAIKDKASELKFSSSAAKRDFIGYVKSHNLSVDENGIIGYSDVLARYKAENPDAIIEPQPEPALGQPAPKIVIPSGGTEPAKKLTLTEMMKRKNADPNYIPQFD